jgi:hypothetical protein
MRADVFRRLTEFVEHVDDFREQEAWSKLAQNARNDWARENPN